MNTIELWGGVLINKVLYFLVATIITSTVFANTLVETGFLRDKTGLPISGNVTMHYWIYNVPQGGSPLWDSGALSVSINEGLYSVALGTTQNPIDETVITDSGNYYIEYSINGDRFNSRDFIAYTARSVLANRAIAADRAATANVALEAKQLRSAVTIKTLSSQIQMTDSVILADANGQDVTVTLPLASDVPGREFRIKKVDHSIHDVFILSQGSDTIDSVALYRLTAFGEYIWVISKGDSWMIVGNN